MSRATLSAPSEERSTEFAARARVAWARLIREVYEADPPECPKCQPPMRVISLIEDPPAMAALAAMGLPWARS